ncbi:MAG: hypothetical protein JKY33_09365 [Bacteroidia bacterium]|nr:hypothetical protein [Bacteroidia bacterium]
MTKQVFISGFLISLLFSNFLALASDKYDYGAGIRIGEQTGLSIQKYINRRTIEFLITSSIQKDESAYYKRWDNYCKDRYPFASKFEYLDYGSTPRISIHSHYKGKTRIPEIKNLHLYYGIGIQIRYHVYYYDFKYMLYDETEWKYSDKKTIPDIDIGPDWLFGFDYKIPETRFIVYVEFNVFWEFINHPSVWSQPGFGVNYLFNY